MKSAIIKVCASHFGNSKDKTTKRLSNEWRNRERNCEAEDGSTITLYAKQKKRHSCTEQNFGLCGRRRGWDVSREQHQNMYIISMVKQITSPGWMHETSAWTWCTGKTQRERVEREVGGGIGMGNTCKSMADSCQRMTKTTTIL